MSKPSQRTVDHDPVVEDLLRAELKRHGERWTSVYKCLADPDRIDCLGRLTARRLVSEAHATRNQQAAGDDETPYTLDPELQETRGPLGSDTGGGKRVIRGTKSLT